MLGLMAFVHRKKLQRERQIEKNRVHRARYMAKQRNARRARVRALKNHEVVNGVLCEVFVPVYTDRVAELVERYRANARKAEQIEKTPAWLSCQEWREGYAEVREELKRLERDSDEAMRELGTLRRRGKRGEASAW